MPARQLHPASLSPSILASKLRILAQRFMTSYGKRSNVTSACEACRQKKSRCDGNQPCATCTSLRKECIFLRKDRRRQHERGEPLRALQAELENLQVTMEVFRFGSDDDALEALKELRSGTPDDASQIMSDTTPQETSQPSPSTPYNKGHKPSIKRQWGDRETSSQDPLAIPPAFTISRLPPESVIRTGAQLFFDIFPSLLYVVDERYFDDICKRVYHSQSSTTNFDVAEVCVIAAIGLQFDPDPYVTEIRDVLFRTGILYMNDLIDEDSVRALRCLACTCVYGMLKRRMSIRASIHLGLQVARWNPDQSEELGEEHAEFKRLFKTMVILECWLSTTLGYNPDLHTSELRLIQELPIPSGSDPKEMSRAKIGELGLLRVRILKHVCSTRPSGAATTEHLTTDMETWYQSLPSSMGLTALFQQKPDVHVTKSRCAPILAHAKYLGAVILLHRRVLVATAETILENALNASSVTLGQAQRPHYLCVEAARSSARIFVLLDASRESSKLYTKCWLFVFEIFTVATVLLYDVALKMSMNLHWDTVLFEDFERTKACLTILEQSFATDPVAQRRETILFSVYHDLKAMHTNLVYGPATVSASSSATRQNLVPPTPRNLMQPPPAPLSPRQDTTKTTADPLLHDITTQAIKALVVILKDPFGYGEDVGFNILPQEPDTMDLERDRVARVP